MERKFLIGVGILLCLLLSQKVNAQNYNFSIGPRFGTSNGLSMKYITAELQGVETIVHFQDGGSKITFMYEGMLHSKHRSFTSGMHLIYAAGVHGARYADYKVVNQFGTQTVDFYGFGVDIKLGFEYCMKAPITIGMEVKPFYEIVTQEDVNNGFMDITMTIRHSIF